MAAPDDIEQMLQPHAFASLKREVGALLDLDPPARVSRLAALEHDDPELARNARALLLHVRESDLAPAAAPNDTLPTAFGPYRVLRRLGRGGMGEVFLGERSDGSFEQRVAIKRVQRGALSPDADRRFLLERRLLARLQHPGIARLLDGGVAQDGTPWLAMEYVEGTTLLAHAAQCALDVPARVRLMRGVCAAVAHAHRHLVVHRDLKPANVIVTPDGEPRLLDFGIAKLLDDDDTDATSTGHRALTFRYAAPEQIKGERTTTATDGYALGVLLAELVAAAPPARDAGLRRRIRGDLGFIARKAAAALPAQRYESVAALDADLDDWLARRPLRSGIGSAREQTRYLLRRYRWPLALALGVLLASGVGAVVAWQQALQARAQTAVAQAHLAMLLDVLGTANPGKFAGSEPRASQFLLAAAQRIDAASDDHPALAHRALAVIGHALINLGHAGQAEPVLLRAEFASLRDPRAGAASRLDVLGLLVQAQDQPAALQRMGATVTRIESLANDASVPRGRLADALARAGGALSGAGDDAGAQRVLARARTVIENVPDADPGVVENLWRQDGWAALRAMRLVRARASLERARDIASADAARFSPMRVAEAHALVAGAALLQEDTAAARAALDLARGTYHSEYPPGHPEHASFELLEARLDLLQGKPASAQARLDLAVAVLAANAKPDVRDAFVASALQAVAAARLAQCDAALGSLRRAQAQFDTLPVRLRREQMQLDGAQAEVGTHCGKPS